MRLQGLVDQVLWRRHIVVCAASLLVLAACGGGGGSSSAQIIMKVGHDSPTNSPYQAGWEAFKTEVESKTNGRIKVVIYPNAQLGQEDVMVNGLKIGAIDGVIAATSTLATAVPEAQLYSMPFLFKDARQAMAVAQGPIGKPIADKIQTATAAQLVGWGELGERDMINKKHPIRTVADLKGLKMRVQAQPIGLATYTAMGALPAAVSFAEVYTSLQTGVVDGSDNPPVDILDSKFYQVTKYLTYTKHFVVLDAILVSDKFLAKLTSADQAIVKAAAANSGQTEAAASDSAETAAVAQFPGLGLQVTELDASARAGFVAAMQPVYQKFADQVGGMSVIQQIQNGS